MSDYDLDEILEEVHGSFLFDSSTSNYVTTTVTVTDSDTEQDNEVNNNDGSGSGLMTTKPPKQQQQHQQFTYTDGAKQLPSLQVNKVHTSRT